MTSFLLDRDVLSAAENPAGNRHVHTWIEGIPDSDLFISSITVMEARKGFARLRSKSGNAAAAKAIQSYEADFGVSLASYDGRILAIDRAVADRWGEMLGQREANVMDTAFAATAAVCGLVVATRNLRHFRGRNIRLVDPFKASPSIEEPADTRAN